LFRVCELDSLSTVTIPDTFWNTHTNVRGSQWMSVAVHFFNLEENNGVSCAI